MTTQEKLTKIESVIRECCPELQELSFGCEIRIQCMPHRVYKYIGHSEDKPMYVYDKGDKERSLNLLHIDYKIEIIGHPIHLEHILRAMSQKYEECIQYHVVYPRNMMMTRWELPDQRGKHYPALFDLTKPYHLQSDEFIGWLYGVLVNE